MGLQVESEVSGELRRVLGQERAIQRLLDAERSNRFPSGWIFSGLAGVGKKMTALGVTQRLVCNNSENLGCGECPPCLRVAKQQSESLLVISSEEGKSSAAIKIDQIREIVRFTSFSSVDKARVIIIDGAEKMNPAASNALLKSLEEPPPGTYFFLLTTSLSALLPTIRSRAQVLRFEALSNDVLKKLYPEEKEWLFESSGGSIEQLENLRSGDWQELRNVSLQWISDILHMAKYPFFANIKEPAKDKESLLFIIKVYQKLLHDVYLCRQGHGMEKNTSAAISGPMKKLIQRISEFSSEELTKLWDSLGKLEKDVRGNVDRSLALENHLMAWASACDK